MITLSATGPGFHHTQRKEAADAISLLYVVLRWRYRRLEKGPLDIADMST